MIRSVFIPFWPMTPYKNDPKREIFPLQFSHWAEICPFFLPSFSSHLMSFQMRLQLTLNLLFIFQINQLIVRSIKCQKINAFYNFPELKLSSKRSFVFESKKMTPKKLKDSSLRIINGIRKQQILALMKLKTANVWHFFLKNDWNVQLMSEKLPLFYLITDRLFQPKF